MNHHKHVWTDTGDMVSRQCCGLGLEPVYACECGARVVGTPKEPTYAPGGAHAYPTVQPVSERPIKLPTNVEAQRAFNCSHLDDGGKDYAFAVRERWGGARFRSGRLGPELRHRGTLWPVKVKHPMCVRGREDPRLFRFRGRTHVAFTGLPNGPGQECGILYADVSEPLKTQPIAPKYAHRAATEKNWGFFESGGDLFAVYQIGPVHRVLKIEGDRITAVHETSWSPCDSWGPLRGGASPLRVGDEFYSFYHTRQYPSEKSQWTIYTMGVYTFDAKPPFAPKRWASEPLIIAGKTKPGWAVIFPGGASLRDGRFLITGGEHDRACKAWEFQAADIEGVLKPC